MNVLFVTLFLTNFLKTIGIIVVVYYGLKFLARLLFPIIVTKAVNNMQERQAQYQRQHQQKPQGEVTIEQKQNRNGQVNNNEGEYVDFEEVN